MTYQIQSRTPRALVALGVVHFLWISAVATPRTARADAARTASADASLNARLRTAREHFLRAVQFYDNADYKLALVEFRRSYELSQNYRILYNIGQVNHQLNHYTKALEALELYLKNGGAEIASERRSEVLGSLDDLSKKIAHVVLVLNVGAARLFVDEEPLGTKRSGDMITIDAGDHRIEARREGYEPARRFVTLTGSETTRLELRLLEVKPVVVVQRDKEAETTNARSFMWAGWTTTGVLAIAAGVTGGFAASYASNLAELKNSPASTSRERQTVGDRARSFAVASDILTGAAVATGALSIYLTLSSSGESETARKAKTAVGFTPTGIVLVHRR
jgi:hypothetical protein